MIDGLLMVSAPPGEPFHFSPF